jgi:pyrroloquinoline quinone biosynthesis protein E
MLPGLSFPNVRDMDVKQIWYESDGFNRFRGDDWMQEPCRSCAEKEKDRGGCRCQAYMLAGDAAAADPVCDKSAAHHTVLEAVERAQHPELHAVRETPLVFRGPVESKRLIAEARRVEVR